jgi:hypothetical protein
VKSIVVIPLLALIVCAIPCCDTDETENTIDPCPGWPAFKVGNEWEYHFHPLYSQPYPIYWIADSVVLINNRNYFRIKEIDLYSWWPDTLHYRYYRSNNDTLFLFVDYESYEFKQYIFNLPKDSVWINETKRDGNYNVIFNKDTLYCKNEITCSVKEFIYCKQNESDDCYVDKVSEEFGFCERDCYGKPLWTLESFKSAKDGD